MAEQRLFKNGEFEFIGQLSYGDTPMSTKNVGEKGWKRTKLGVSVRNEANSQFLALEYIHNDNVRQCKLFGKDGTQIEVNLSDTHKQEILDKVADFTKTTIDLESDFDKKKEYMSLIFKRLNHERKEEKTEDDITKIEEYTKQINELAVNRVTFCHMQDVIKFLNASLPTIGKSKVRVKGSVKSNYYNGSNRLQYIPNLIELVPEETPNQLKVMVDFFYEKNSIDDNTKEKRMFINGWIGEKVKKSDKLYPLQVVVDYTKIDETNEEHQMLLKFMKDIFKITDKKQVHKIGLIINAINGAEVVEFNEDCLTDKQKMAIHLGMNTLEDFKPRGYTYGERIQELRVINADYRTYKDGSVEVFEADEINNYLVADDSDIKADDIKAEPIKDEKEDSNNSTEDLMAKLFG